MAVANLIRGIAGALLAAAVVLLALPAPTLAGCATIPKPPVEFAWRRGRIDRVFISPGDTVRITIDTPEDPTARSAAAMGVNQVIVLMKPLTKGEMPRNVLTAMREPEREACSFTELCSPSFGSGSREVRLSTLAAPGALLVGFQFPPEQVAAGPALLAIPWPGQPIPDSIANEGCDSEAGRALLACIDKVTPPPSDVTGAAAPTALTVLGPKNNFKHICKHDADCDGTAAAVCFTLNADGDALIDMTWKDVLNPTNPTQKHRKVSGSSSVSAFERTPGWISVPNDDFLEATDGSGNSLGKKPKFDVDKRPDRLHELNLSGLTDVDASTLHIFRRRLANRCAGGPKANQLCIPEYPDCPASTCTKLPASAYFSCTNAPDRPCTRDSDCSPNDNCGGRPSTCRTTTGESTGAPCTTDADCNTGEECGPSLFDFRSRRAPDGSVCISRRPATPVAQPTPPPGQSTPTPTPTFAGVCDGGTNHDQPCNSDLQCPTASPDSVECVGFRAEVGKYE